MIWAAVIVGAFAAYVLWNISRAVARVAAEHGLKAGTSFAFSIAPLILGLTSTLVGLGGFVIAFVTNQQSWAVFFMVFAVSGLVAMAVTDKSGIVL